MRHNIMNICFLNDWLERVLQIFITISKLFVLLLLFITRSLLLKGFNNKMLQIIDHVYKV